MEQLTSDRRNEPSLQERGEKIHVFTHETVAPTPYGHGWHVVPTFTNGWSRKGTVSRRTTNEKLTKLY